MFAPDDSRKNPEECEASLGALVSSDPNWCDHRPCVIQRRRRLVELNSWQEAAEEPSRRSSQGRTVAISGLNGSARHRCEMDWLHQIGPSWAVQTESIPPIVHVVKHDVGMTETGVFTIENYLAVLSECSMGLRHWQLIAAADRHLPSRCAQASALPARLGAARLAVPTTTDRSASSRKESSACRE